MATTPLPTRRTRTRRDLYGTAPVKKAAAPAKKTASAAPLKRAGTPSTNPAGAAMRARKSMGQAKAMRNRKTR